jgi:hypothetical protein
MSRCRLVLRAMVPRGAVPRVMVLGTAVVAALVLALVAGGVGLGLGRTTADAHTDDRMCHAAVNCVGQVANTPLGSSALPVVAVVVAAALGLVAHLRLAPLPWRDRLAAGRLFRPPRLTL